MQASSVVPTGRESGRGHHHARDHAIFAWRSPPELFPEVKSAPFRGVAFSDPERDPLHEFDARAGRAAGTWKARPWHRAHHP